MGLESTMICVDNSDWMRNSDFIPSRLQSQFDAVNMVALAKTKANPENNVGLLTLTDNRVLVTLTTEVGKIISKLHLVKPDGSIDIIHGIKVANLALKHRQSKNHKPRIVMFVASPVKCDQPELVKLSKRLKKEKVNVDIINFGEEESNAVILNDIVNTINGKEGTGSHLISVAAPANLSDAMFSSPIFQGEDGQSSGLPAGFGPGFQYGMEDDPELAMALRISMEESRLKQEADAGGEKKPDGMETDQPAAGAKAAEIKTEDSGEVKMEASEDDLLQQALALSLTASQQEQQQQAQTKKEEPNLAAMTEEEQLHYALQMSMAAPSTTTPSATAATASTTTASSSGATSTVPTTASKTVDAEMKDEDEDYAKAMNDPEFLQRVISSLPGVDPNSDAVRSAFENLTKESKEEADKKKKKEEEDSKK